MDGNELTGHKVETYDEEQERKRNANRERMAKARAARKIRRIVRKDAVSSATVKTATPSVAAKIDNRVPADKIMFFTKHDLDAQGRIKNAYPTHYNKKQADDLREEIRMYENGLEKGYFDKARYGEVTSKLKQAKEVLDQIEASRPNFEKQKDSIAKIVKDAGELIRDAMYRRDEDRKGLVDPHEVARRWSTPCIKVSDEIATVALNNGKKVTKDGKMNLVELTQLWQYGRDAVDEGLSRDAETLRRD